MRAIRWNLEQITNATILKKENKYDLLTVALLKRATKERFPQGHFFKDRRDQFTHSRSFFKSDDSESLTVTLFERSTRAKER